MYGLDYDDFCNDKNAMLCGMRGASTCRQPIISEVEVTRSEEVDIWVDEDPVSPLTCERKRVSSTETGCESPPKRTLALRDLETWKLDQMDG